MAQSYEDKAAAAAQQATKTGADLYETAKDKAQAAIDAGREGVDALADEGQRQIDAVSDKIRDWPLLSVGVAFLAGCVVSRLFHK